MKKYLLLLSVTLVFASCSSNNDSSNKTEQAVSDTAKQNLFENNVNDIYDNFGIIKVKDPLATHIGYPADSADVFFISLRDVGKFHGKVCPGIATGFKMIKDVLDSLYGDEIPVRGNIKVACSRGSDLLDVAGYITGARNNIGRGEINRGDLVIDTTLNPHIPYAFTMIFSRKDLGKMYKVVFHKDRLLTPEDRKFIFSVDKEVFYNHADSATQAKFKEIVQKEVKRTLTEGPRKGVYEITRYKDYKFK